jgi:hypothetical protein
MSGAASAMRVLLPPLLILFTTGCTLLPVGGKVNVSPGGKPSPMRSGLKDYRAVFHCHSLLSHDSEGTFEGIAAAARKLGHNVVLLTDHYEPGNVGKSPRGILDSVLFIPGIERPKEGGGSLLIVRPLAEIDKHAPEAQLLEALEKQGAFLVAGHVEEIPAEADLSRFQGFEIYNLHAEFKSSSRRSTLVKFMFFFPDSFFEAAVKNPVENLRRWDRELARGSRLIPLAGHDAHENVKLFGPLGGTVGTYEEVFRLFSTHILAAELTEEAILEGLRRGHVYVTFDFVADGGGFSMRYGGRGPSGEEWAIIGETTPYRRSAYLEVRLPRKALVRVLRDGAAIIEQEAKVLSQPLPGPGIYRVEAYIDERLWIAGAPMYITSPGR